MKARWASYFERPYQADPPTVELDVQGVSIPVADPPINSGPPSLVETQAAVNRLKWGKAPGICGIHVQQTTYPRVIMVYFDLILLTVWKPLFSV